MNEVLARAALCEDPLSKLLVWASVRVMGIGLRDFADGIGIGARSLANLRAGSGAKPNHQTVSNILAFFNAAQNVLTDFLSGAAGVGVS
jgi:hypothetical protein